MENKNEKSMTLEEMIGEMLKDAKVVKTPFPAKAEEKTENQQQDKPQQVRPSGTPFISLSIENLHLHMDERMTSYNNFEGDSDEADEPEEDEAEDIDVDAMIGLIKAKTGLCEKVILAVLVAQEEYLDSIWGEDTEEDEA